MLSHGSSRFAEEELFALRIRGESMRDAGILPGDIVAALVGEEATVKRLRMKNGRIELHPENPDFEPVIPDPFSGLIRADELEGAHAEGGYPNRAVTDWWTLEELIGRLVEISGGRRPRAVGRPSGVGGTAGRPSTERGPAVLTVACLLLLEAQRLRVPAAWVSVGRSSFYPPDMAENGVDLSALPVIWAGDPQAAGRAADWLLRSAAFGLLIIDMQGGGRLPQSLQGRLVQLARKHRAALICLTEGAADSLGSLVSLRAEASWERTDPSRMLCEIHVLKDKRRGPGWRHTEVCRGPAGLH